MKYVTIICVALLLAGMSASQDRGDVRERFAGAWRLVRLEQPGTDGTLHDVECTGMFVFTRDGRAAVQVMERTPGSPTTKAPEQYSQGGYEASWGTYQVDERNHTFTFHIDGALVRQLVGKDLTRSYEFSGNRLIVRSTRPDEHWRVTWDRY